MSVNSKVAELFAEAVYEGRDDVITAISPFISIKDLADALEKNKRIFGDKFKEAFYRTEYSGDDVSALGWKSLIDGIKGYQDFYLSLGSREGVEDSSRHRFIQSYASKGYYQAALNTFNALEDKDGYKAELTDLFNHWRSTSRNPLFVFMGHPHAWDLHAVELFSALDLEMDDSFAKYDRTAQNSPWTASRCEAQINAVGAWQAEREQGMPTVELVNGEVCFVEGQMLTKAVSNEFARLNTPSRQDGWNVKNFPRYLPVRVSAEDINELVMHGALPLRRQQIPDSISHGFECLKGSVSPGHTAMAMSLLSLEAVAEVHQDERIHMALLPIESLQPPQIDVDPDLTMRMQWHRPELLRVLLDKDDVPYNYFDGNASVHLYLRGCPLKGDYLNSRFELGLGVTDATVLKYFTAPGEQAFVRDHVGTMSYTQSSHNVTAQVSEFVRQYELAKAYMGINPKVILAGNMEFMEAVSRLDLPLSISRALEYEFDDPTSARGNAFCGDYGISRHHRLAARLCGFEGRTSSRYGKEPGELLTKALRLKNDENAKEEIKGLLDRFPLKEIALAAKTDKQFEFVAENFDLSGIYAELPPKLRHKIGRDVLSSGLDI